ncbi:ABC transporter permease subunit, partial [Alicyclobacillus fodiniaquatilis]
MRELGRVFSNEWLKLVRRKRLWITTIIGLLVICLFGLNEYQTHKDIKFSDPTYQLQNIEGQVQSIKAEMKSTTDEAARKGDNAQLQSLKSEQKSLQAQIAQNKTLQTGNWKPIVQNELKQQTQAYQQAVKAAKANHTPPPMGKEAILDAAYQLQHNVRPFTPWQPSPFTEVSQFLSTALRLFVPLMVVILVADMISGEATSGTIKLLLIRPVPRWKIFCGKWAVSIFATVLLTFLMYAALFLVSGLFFGFHGGQQPTLVGTQYQTMALPGQSGGTELAPDYTHTTAISQIRFLGSSCLLAMLAMCVIATITLFFSSLLTSAMASTAASLGIVILGFIITTMSIHTAWLKLFFAIHLDPGDLWSGAVSSDLGSHLGLQFGIVTLLVWGIVA